MILSGYFDSAYNVLQNDTVFAIVQLLFTNVCLVSNDKEI